MTPHAIRATVCVASMGRMGGLQRLLEALARLSFPDIAEPSIDIVVVDNRAEGEAADPIVHVGAEYPWPVRVVREERVGIPYARNRALRAVGPDTDYVVFIDDDEFPDPLWLQELVSVQRAFDAHVVEGPVLPEFPSPVPGWIHTGRFFHRDRFQTGARRTLAATSNVLILWSAVAPLDVWFDERLARCGGSDSLYFRMLHHRGCRIVWADEAIVREIIPLERANQGWLLRRAYRIGNTSGMVDRLAPASPLVPAFRVVKAGVWLVRGLLRVPFALVGGRAALVSGLQEIVRGVGNLTGLLGITPRRYA
jgi:succinoglycan biosynthesis protein ExoM